MIAQATGPPAFAFKPVRQPMLWAALTYSLGIVAGIYAWRPALWWIAAALAFIAAGAYFLQRRRWMAVALALATLFLVGAFQIQMRGVIPRLDPSIRPFADGQEIQITAHVIREGRPRPDSFGEARQTVDVESEAVKTSTGEMAPVRSGIRMGIYARLPKTIDADSDTGSTDAAVSPIRLFHYGERIRFTAKLKPPHNFRNPGAFDYEDYLASNGIAALGSAKLENIELLPGFTGRRIELWRTRIHASVIAKVHQLWPPREAALIDAMIIGEAAFIERDTQADFQRSGTYHVLVVSGMNVSILAFAVFWTLRRLRLSDVPATVLTVLCCFSYAFLTDVGAPVWRATLMCTLYLGTRLLYRDRATLNALGAAALGLLIYDPRQLFTASLQMTFLCLLIVAGIGIPILERTSQLYRRALLNWDSPDYAASLPPRVGQFRVDLHFVAQRVSRFIGEIWSQRLVCFCARASLGIFELFFISAVMQIGLSLPMAFYFHRATTVGLPANLAVVPLTELMMPAAIASLALGYISLWLAKIPVLLTSLALEAIAGTVHGLGGLRLADLRVATPSLWLIAAAAAALVVAMMMARRRASLALSGLTALMIASLTLTFLPPAPQLRPNTLEVTSIDVGQGDSTLIVTPQGRTLLIDAGGPVGPGGSRLDFGEDVVSPYLWTRGVSRLDAVAITHGHSDHIGGMAAVLENFHPREFWIGALPPSRALESLIAEAHALDIKIVRHWEGDELDLGGAHVSVLFPPRDWPVGSKPQNNDSLVMRISYRNSSVLLEGDAEKQVERRVAALHHPQADLLRVGHHGSATASTPELLQSVHASFAVISVGLGNPFHLPRLDVLDRLAASGARVYRTDLDGEVTFYLDGNSVTPALAALGKP